MVTLLFVIPLGYLTFSVFYYVFLAAAYFAAREKRPSPDAVRGHKYLLLIPAHNEEPIIGRILSSLRESKYAHTQFKTWVIADNCADKTALLARQYGAKALVRYDETRKGKGFAIEWALKVLDTSPFDAVVVADADNIIDPWFFHGLDEALNSGSRVVQCNNCLANPGETAFTRVIHLSRTINNLLCHHAKYKLGLSSYLMGNGMCFTTGLLERYPFSTGTMAEDYEYYAILAAHDEPIGFAVNSKLYHQESKDLRCASRQRLRWSSGRFEVARKFGLKLFMQGIRARNLRMIDASFPLILPNLSLMVNLTVLTAAAGVLVHYLIHPVPHIILWSGILIALELAYFISGVRLARMRVFSFLFALCFAPVFLLWKGCIDVLGLSGTSLGQWGRSGRA